MTYIATLFVPATTTVWPAEDVPWLTASALHPIPDVPEPPVTELLRLDTKDGRQIQSPLSPEDRAALEHVWAANNLPSEVGALTADEWTPYLVAFNEAPDHPPWQFAVMPPRDPYRERRVLRCIAQEAHTKALKHAIEARQVNAREAGSMVPAGEWLHLRQLVLTRDALIQFCEMVCLRVADLPADGATAPNHRKPAPVTEQAPPLTHWKMRVQAEAAAEWRRMRAMNCNPTLASIRPHLLKWCRENNVKTNSNINPSDGYLRTHVLSSQHWTPPAD
jgi:hypothetical protein